MDTMNSMDDPRMYMHTAFWQDNQVVLAFHSDVSVNSAPAESSIPVSKETILRTLNLSGIGELLSKNHYELLSFTDKDILQASQPPQSRAGPPVQDLYNPLGKYLFNAPGGDGTTVIAFFRFRPLDAQAQVAAGTPAAMAGTEMGGDGDDSGKKPLPPINNVTNVVNIINRSLKQFRAEQSYLVGATPNWYSGASNGTDTPRAQGCPLTPPMPVPGDIACPAVPGLFPISLPELPHDWQEMTGDGVTVLILDTLPTAGEIARAAEAAEDRNLLLLDVANNVTFHHNTLAASLDVPSPMRPVTGKDIYGRIIGFHMPDHGLFSAGIIRDLAPNASVECIRVLNDYCVGDLAMLTKALEDIQGRMSSNDPNTGQQGDLYGKPVVINMSLVVSPPDGDIISRSFDPGFISEVRASLRGPIQSLAAQGAIMVASSGNEADLRNNVMNPQGIRPGPLYPAAFADSPDNIEAVIPVGAVNKDGKAASYSNYPGPRGVGTYGGDIPVPVPATPPGCMTGAKDIDSVIGIYTALSYPALSGFDCETSYHEPNASAWAYWSGTSFATPIISALAARALERRLRQGSNASVASMLSSAAAGQVNWDRLESAPHSVPGPMVRAVQCHARREEMEEREVEINITEMNIVQVDE